MNKTNDFKYNLPAYSDPVDIEDLNDNFRGIDDALMAGLCKKDYTGNNMGSSDPSARKHAWAPWLEIVNDNEFDVVVTDRNAPVESEEATINIAAGQTFRKYINGRYYMNFYVQDQHDVTFKWFTNAETYINESGGGGTGTVTSVSVQGGSGSHLTGSGNPIETSGTITINVDEGYSIPSDDKQTAWDRKAADLKAEIDSSTYVLTLQLKDSSGNLIGNERTIDLPLETMVVDGEYDPQTQKIKLELKNGNYVEFSVADLVSGLQTELSASNKLDPDYIDYDSTHRAVTDTEKDTWNAKQNALTFDDTPTQNSDNPVKSGGIFTALAGKGTYSKPQNGIPKTDLESAVQTSLGLADSALQSETDPTVPSWAKQTNKPSYTQDEVGDGTTYKRVSSTEKDTWNAKGTYSKPSGGIPKSDLASAVQTSLGKADTALQSFAETDPTVPSWAKAANKPTYTASEVGAIATTAKGANSGVAELDANGKVPSSQLPSYVDDVLEYSAKSSFPATGETGKIYVDTATNLTYRWSGTAYVEISPSIALGETSSTAYRGDRGKDAYNHATDSNKLTTATASGLYKVASTSQGHIASLTAVAKSDITGLGIPAQDTTYSVATTSDNGLMSSTDKSKLDGIASGAQVNSITGVKGDAESNYRTGNVNLTAANIGAAASSHTHNYAGSASAGGAATSANKLNVGSSNIGSATQPVYFNASTGLPVATTYSLAKSVPSNAKFTDTTYSAATTSVAGLMSASDKSKLDGISTGANKIGYVIKQINLSNDLIWSQSMSGMYYTSKVSIPELSRVLGVTICGFYNLKNTDVITPRIYGDSNYNGISFFGNTSTFSSGANVDVQVFGIV